MVAMGKQGSFGMSGVLVSFWLHSRRLRRISLVPGTADGEELKVVAFFFRLF